MLTGLAVIVISGFFLGRLAEKIKLPPLVGMIAAGIALGPYAADLIDHNTMALSADLRQAALVIILTRAGLSLDTGDLKKAGLPALLMCFVPAVFEICGTALLAPMIFGVTVKEALVIGSVLAAVSPAVVVPRMIRLMDEGWGTEKRIPQVILAGASADDIFVIVLFSVFTSLLSADGDLSGKELALEMAGVPLSIILGALLGISGGFLMKLLFRLVHMRDTVKAAVMLSLSFLMIFLQNTLADIVSISALVAITAMGITLKKTEPDRSKRLSSKYNKLWAGAEIVLFVLVGAEVRISDAFTFGGGAVLLVLLALIFRMAGVFVSVSSRGGLTMKEKLFCMLSYLPKATVQAAIGAVPLSMGFDCGSLTLTCAVLAILITAPLGALCIDRTYKTLLSRKE